MDTHEYYMSIALEEAVLAMQKDEVPIGAIVVRNGEIIGRGHNLKESLKRASAHAEVIAIDRASEKLGGWRLTDSTLYVTIEPCSMCAGLIYQARVKQIVFGAKDPKGGACGTTMNVLANPAINHSVDIISGIMETECSAIIKAFFKAKRNK